MSRTSRVVAQWMVGACAVAATAGAAPADPRFPTQPVQPGKIQQQPGTGMAPLTKEIAIWVFADIKLAVLGPTTVKIDWQSRQDAAAYRIVRNGVAIADVPSHAPPLTFLDDGLAPGGTATYTVQALPAPPAPSGLVASKMIRGPAVEKSFAKESILDESRAMSATTPALAPPIDLVANAVSLTAVHLTWTPPRWSTGYQVWRDRQVIRTGNGGNVADDAPVPPGTHIYAVQSMFARADGTPLPGPVSQEVSIKVGPKLCTPGTKQSCDYTGSAHTSHCALGEQVCNAQGDAFGACQDSQFRCGDWDTISFKECAFMGQAKYVGVLRNIPSGDSAEQYVLRHRANVNGVDMNAKAYSRDLVGNQWGSFEVSHSQCFVYNFDFWKTCSSPLSGSNLYRDPATNRTYREGFTGVCLGECFGSNERKVYYTEPVWGSEPFTPGAKRCETIVTKTFEW